MANSLHSTTATAASLTNEIKKAGNDKLQLELVESIAQQFQADVDKDMCVKDELRIVARDLEKATKSVVHVLQRIHIDAESDEKVLAIGRKAEALLQKEVVPLSHVAREKMPPGEYFKYSEFLRTHFVRSVFSIGLYQFLIDTSFVTIDKVSQILELPTIENRGTSSVCLEWEAYLEGMIEVGQELARLAKNCVILDNFSLVDKIHKYISTLNYGFSGMNFKNDTLRRKYDSLKYDARAIEEVVYDLRMQKAENVEKS